MLWLGTGLLVALALFFLLRPFLRTSPSTPEAAAYDLEVYHDQLAEVARDLERGTIGEAEAQAAEVEIKRRMLAADERRAGEASSTGSVAAAASDKGNRRLGLALALLLPVFVGGLYIGLGSPGQPSQPFAERKAPAIDKRVAAILARLEAAVKAKPDDLLAWLKLGQAQWGLKRWRAAAVSFGRAWKLAPARTDIGGAYAEALVRANRGIVTREARRAFETVLKREPQNPRARFFIGLADAQAGRTRVALRRWILLEADSQAGAPWLARLRAEIAKTARDNEIDLPRLRKAVLANRPKPVAPPGGAKPRGPTAEDIRRARRMTPEARMEMIRGMVSGLEARLKDNPKDVAGWRRLGRSYTVLGDKKKAVAAYRKAAELAPESAAILADYAVAMMREAGNDKPLSLEVVLVLRRILSLDDENAFALYFLGRSKNESGDPAGALVYWRKLLAQLPQNSPMRPRLSREIAEAEKKLPEKK